MTNLAIVQGQGQQVSGSLTIQTVDDLSRISKMMAASGFFADCKEAAQAGVKILAGLELGFPAFASLTGIQIIKGRPVMGANLQAAAIKRSGKYNYKVRSHTVDRCALEFFEKFNNEWEAIGLSEFTIEDARSAGLASGDNWKKYPKNMLFARAIGNGVRFFCPDLFLGAPVYSPDELGLPVNSDGDFIEAEISPVSVSTVVSPADIPGSIDRLSALRTLTGHTKQQCIPLALSIDLKTSEAAQWTSEECDRFRNALLLDYAAKYPTVFNQENHRNAAFKIVVNSFEFAPSDEQLFEAWKADLERRSAEKSSVEVEEDPIAL